MILTRAILIAFVIAPATTRSAIDLSTPQNALQSMHDAVERGDGDAIASILYQTNDSQMKLNRAYSALIVASRHLADSIADKFGTGGDMLALSAASIPDVKSPDAPQIVQQDDQTVTLKLRGRARDIVTHRDASGNWHIDLLSFADASTENLPQQLGMLNDLTKSFAELSVDVRDDRYRAIADVKAAIQDRVHSAVARSMRHSGPATNPASNPSTKPASR